MLSTKACSIPVSARDSLAISYQLPAFERVLDEEEGDEPKIIRSDPNASMTGATKEISISLVMVTSRKSPLTIHLDTTLPLIQLLSVICFDWTTRERGLRGWRIPIRRKEFDLDLGGKR